MSITMLPADPIRAMQLVAQAHAESQAAFMSLGGASPLENATKRELHTTYREKTAHLLELLRWHNESGLAPSPWDLTIVAQPLVQQTMIEADILDALGEPSEGARLREWAVGVAKRDLPPLAFARVRRGIVAQRASEGRFNEALAEYDDLRREFAGAGEVVQSAQTTLDQAGLLEWLGDDERALDAIAAARRLVASKLDAQTS